MRADGPVVAEPVPAAWHRSRSRWHGVSATTTVTVYLVLLILLPSNLTVTALGSLGQPALLWGLTMFAWWVIVRIQAREPLSFVVSQPTRFAFVMLLVVALISFAVAMMRGQPTDQISPAITALVRLLSWAGVLMVILDGVRTKADLVSLVRRVGALTGLLALLGLAQFLTRSTLLDVFTMLPGFSMGDVEGTAVAERGGVARVPATAIHPLEFSTVLNAALPLVIAAAVTHGFRSRSAVQRYLWWVPAALIALSALLGVSRSAIIGFAVACVTMLPALPSRYRAWVIVGGGVLAAVAVAAVPGLMTTTLQLFAGAGSDPSTQSRTGGLERAPEFIAASPIVGVGFGTFLPRYYIFDNQWVLMAVELGLLGVIAFFGIFAGAIWSAMTARRRSADDDTRTLGYALAAAMVNIAVLFAFFDGMAFPMSAGILIVLAGMCGATHTVAAAEAIPRAPYRGSPPPGGGERAVRQTFEARSARFKEPTSAPEQAIPAPEARSFDDS